MNPHDKAQAIEVAISHLEDERFAAMQSCDVARLDELLDDQLTYIHSSGVTDGKTAYLASLRTGELRYESFERSDTRMDVLGTDVVLILGRIQIQLTLGGARKNLDNLYIDVWAKREEQWRMVSWQSTPLRAQATEPMQEPPER